MDDQLSTEINALLPKYRTALDNALKTVIDKRKVFLPSVDTEPNRPVTRGLTRDLIHGPTIDSVTPPVVRTTRRVDVDTVPLEEHEWHVTYQLSELPLTDTDADSHATTMAQTVAHDLLATAVHGVVGDHVLGTWREAYETLQEARNEQVDAVALLLNAAADAQLNDATHVTLRGQFQPYDKVVIDLPEHSGEVWCAIVNPTRAQLHLALAPSLSWRSWSNAAQIVVTEQSVIITDNSTIAVATGELPTSALPQPQAGAT